MAVIPVDYTLFPHPLSFRCIWQILLLNSKGAAIQGPNTGITLEEFCTVISNLVAEYDKKNTLTYAK